MRDFNCDTPDCIHWNEEDGCTKTTSVKIEEHCCLDYEESLVPKLIISISGGLVQSIYSTLSNDEIKVTVVDFDGLEFGEIAGGLTKANDLIERAVRELHTIY